MEIEKAILGRNKHRMSNFCNFPAPRDNLCGQSPPPGHNVRSIGIDLDITVQKKGIHLCATHVLLKFEKENCSVEEDSLCPPPPPPVEKSTKPNNQWQVIFAIN